MTLRRGVAAAYYGVLVALMVLIIPSWLPHLLPATIAHHISYDSEGYILALVLPLWIAAARPALTGRRNEWPITIGAGLASLVVGILLYNSHILGTIKTLNETFFALAVLIPFAQLRRPLGRYAGVVLAVGALVATVVAEQTPLAHVTSALAEGVVMLILAPIGFDLLDRGLLDRENTSPLGHRVGWCVSLAIMSLAVIGLRDAGVGGPLGDAIDYAARAQEAFVGLFLIHALFLVGGRRRAHRAVPTVAANRSGSARATDAAPVTTATD